MRLRNRRISILAAALATGILVGVQPGLAQVVPTPPPVPPLPGEVTEAAMPAVPAWDASVGTACNLALTVLGLGGLVAGGVPAMLPPTPVVDGSVEARTAIGALSSAGSACFILPFRSVRTTCGVDAQLEGELSGAGGEAGAPVNPGGFTPHVGGAVVDTAIELERAGAPRGTASALDDGLSCEQVDLLAAPEFPLSEVPTDLPFGESSQQDVAAGADGLPTGLSVDLVGSGSSTGPETGSFGSAGGAGGGSMSAKGGSAADRALAATPAGQMSPSRKVVAAVLAGLIALLLAFMCVTHASEAAQRGARRL